MERTLAIVKPDAVERGLAGEILRRIEASGLVVSAIKKIHLSRAQAERFYDVHKEQPFYKSLCDYMTSGAVVIAVLSGDKAITRWRELMGATDPAKADAGTLRKEFAQSIERNATHGSDAPDTASFEIGYFFPGIELI